MRKVDADKFTLLLGLFIKRKRKKPEKRSKLYNQMRTFETFALDCARLN